MTSSLHVGMNECVCMLAFIITKGGVCSFMLRAIVYGECQCVMINKKDITMTCASCFTGKCCVDKVQIEV